MIENMIRVGTVQDFRDVVESYGVPLNKNTVGVVTPEAPKSDLSTVDNASFFDFVKNLGLKASDVAVISDQVLMEMTQEKREPKFREQLTSGNSGSKIRMK